MFKLLHFFPHHSYAKGRLEDGQIVGRCFKNSEMVHNLFIHEATGLKFIYLKSPEMFVIKSADTR